MDYCQYRRVRRMVHECCNYIDGNCIALDDGEECVCVQSISYSLLCRWFRAAVLPQDKELETALFIPGSNRAKYCPECAARMKRINAAKSKDIRQVLTELYEVFDFCAVEEEAHYYENWQS